MKRALEARGKLVDDKVQFQAVARDNPPVQFDFFSPIGTGQGYTGLEGLLMSLAVCSATTLAYLLRKEGKTVTGCEVTAQGTTKELPAVGFESAALYFSLTSGDVTGRDVDLALQRARDSACPVWQMVKGNFEITTEYALQKAL
ncbi:MAG: OsmC family protein [bacterium]|nr:MAG: OsmC family protein [bacterium]